MGGSYSDSRTEVLAGLSESDNSTLMGAIDDYPIRVRWATGLWYGDKNIFYAGCSRDGSSLDSNSKDSYSKQFLLDSTDSRIWGI